MLYPLRIVLHASGCDLLVGADADVIEPTAPAISFSVSTYLSRFGKKCQMWMDPPVSVSPNPAAANA
jgi:hypothetical protein